jgi:hypothetical protein
VSGRLEGAADPGGAPIVVGLDGGHVRNWADKKTSFEVVVGKSVPEDRENRYFGCVPTTGRSAGSSRSCAGRACG